MSRSALLAMALLAPLLAASAETFSLSARPGYFNAKTLGPSAKKSTVSGSVRIVKFNGAKGWPPTAYLGFQQGPDRSQSVQFLILRNQDTDPYVIAGYRVIEGGKEMKVESLANLPLTSPTRVSLTFESGLVTLRLNERAPVLIRTNLLEAAPYVSVSSGTAEFNVDP
jgi:hypothetical protein